MKPSTLSFILTLDPTRYMTNRVSISLILLNIEDYD